MCHNAPWLSAVVELITEYGTVTRMLSSKLNNTVVAIAGKQDMYVFSCATHSN